MHKNVADKDRLLSPGGDRNFQLCVLPGSDNQLNVLAVETKETVYNTVCRFFKQVGFPSVIIKICLLGFSAAQQSSASSSPATVLVW